MFNNFVGKLVLSSVPGFGIEFRWGGHSPVIKLVIGTTLLVLTAISVNGGIHISKPKEAPVCTACKDGQMTCTVHGVDIIMFCAFPHRKSPI
jgi:hypothetical protein